MNFIKSIALIGSCALSFSVMAEEASQLADACNKALGEGNYAQAAELAGKALEASRNDRKAYLCLGRALGGKGDHMGAVTALQAADKLSVGPIDHIVALTLLGNEQLAAHAYAEANDAYKASLDTARADKNRHFERINLNQLGEVRQAMGDAAGALDFYMQGQALAANDNERADGNARIAAAYSLLGNHDKAIEYQLKSLFQEERVGEPDQYANASIEMARIYIVAGQYDNAEKRLNKLLGEVAQAGAAYWEAKVYYTLGKLRSAQGKAAEAMDFYRRGKALAEKIGAQSLAAEIDKVMTGDVSK